MTRKTWLRAGSAVLTVLTAVGVWAGFNASLLRARYAARQLAAATTDEERARHADRLLAYGAPGFAQLVGFVRAGPEPARAAALAALDRHLTGLPDNDPRAVTISGSILDAYPTADEGGKRAVLELVPAVLARTGGTHAERCRAVVSEGLRAADPPAQLTAARLAVHPEIRLRNEVIPLLGATDPQVRRAGLFAVTADGDAFVTDEELFRWLHDPDAGVRKVCHDALVARDRSDAEIALARRLTHPDPGERLKLLLDLRHDDDVHDPEPWLERLSRDPEPAVRAGAARVMVEVASDRKLPLPGWVARVADADAHATVRFVAAYYRAQPGAAGGGGVIPAGR